MSQALEVSSTLQPDFWENPRRDLLGFQAAKLQKDQVGVERTSVRQGEEGGQAKI